MVRFFQNMRLELQHLVVSLFIVKVSASIEKKIQLDDESLKEEESEGRNARFLKFPFYERRLPQSTFMFQGGDLFAKRKFVNFLSLLSDNSKGYKRQGKNQSC